jgi:GNAT superfamily N-acetyltransferase
MIIINKLDESDINDVVILHLNSFNGFFLTSLGKPFLIVFYKSILLSDNGICIGAFSEKKLIGFAIGTKNNTGFYMSLIKKNFLLMTYKALPKLIFNPSNIKRLIVSLSNAGQPTFKNIPSLLSICVAPNQTSKGVGKRLLLAYENQVKNQGFKEIILTTDFHDNDKVNMFYLNNNYVCAQFVFQGNRKMNLYHKKLLI